MSHRIDHLTLWKNTIMKTKQREKMHLQYLHGAYFGPEDRLYIIVLVEI